ncbi:MAG: response regulator transcription factor [bacterium]|nr:response regulator transcription factor [bacterium]
MRVLLVDDHDIIRDGLAGLLEQAGHEIVGQAKDGNEAVKLAAELLPDIVVMDVGMPGMNGVDATRQIVKQKPAPGVVALSMHSDRTYVTRMLDAGARGYIVKESAFEELEHAIDVVAKGGTHLGNVIEGDFIGRVDGASVDPVTLTKKEREVLQLVAEGKSTKEIAKALFVTVKTIETHRYRLMKRLGIHSIAQLTKYAIRHGITSLDS